MNYKSYQLIAIIVLGTITLLSCRKFLEIAPSPNLIHTEAIFSDDKTAVAAAVSVYVQMQSTSLQFTNAGMSFFGGLLADEIINTASSSNYDPFASNSLLPVTTAINGNFWQAAYRNLYKVNAVLEGLEASSLLTDSVKRQLRGEMKVCRAFYYFYLVNLFGDVPLVVTTDYQVNAILPRKPIATVYVQIVKDLEDAGAELSSAYPSAGKARPNKLTAMALLARVYLYQQEWAKAEAASTAVIQSGMYSLSPLNDVFKMNSSETIWNLAPPNEANNTAIGANYIPASATVKPPFVVTDHLLAAFESSDQRKAAWLKANVVNGQSYYYPFKYKSRLATPIAEYLVAFRLAEQYLIRAEARAQLQNLIGSRADVNAVRGRAGLGVTTEASQAGLLSLINRERQVELFTEWGDRWLNLKRTNKADAVLSVVKGASWQATDVLFPLPQGELEFNPYLNQNPGY